MWAAIIGAAIVLLAGLSTYEEGELASQFSQNWLFTVSEVATMAVVGGVLGWFVSLLFRERQR
jgi:hypothetical protein